MLNILRAYTDMKQSIKELKELEKLFDKSIRDYDKTTAYNTLTELSGIADVLSNEIEFLYNRFKDDYTL